MATSGLVACSNSIQCGGLHGQEDNRGDRGNGAQGGGLVRAILADKSGAFAARAITRKPAGDKAQALAKLGVEVVAGDLDDIGSLYKAFAGAYGAYCVTNFWEHFSGEKETSQGQALAHAAKQAGLQHAIWSTFEDTRKAFPLSDSRMPTLKGKYKVPHFDAKAAADHYFRDLGVPTTFLLTSFYWENLIGFGMGPKRAPTASWPSFCPWEARSCPALRWRTSASARSESSSVLS